ncbi:MAG: cadherin-like beta sandwich domain-containing protein [Dehalococcoidia bacterium]|nr:cadherin-like beta sandwich domain-containing protein [Dehalococcoidia bacterium]MYI86609.1 cadherin-like beta sandwich domain-containing protein [Dehalococcoidia bacterium]
MNVDKSSKGAQAVERMAGLGDSEQQPTVVPHEAQSGDLIFGEGQLVISDGVIVQTHFVQLGEAPLFEWPQDSPTLIRGCRVEHAIERGARLRLSKPEAFRYDDGTLIGDPDEGITRHEERRVDHVGVDAPDDMERARGRDAEHNTLAGSIGSRRRVTTTGTRTESVTTSRSRHTHGKNGWILCTSIRPSDPTDLQKWRDSLDSTKDHVTTIESPRDFARALARMVASQLGPRGGPVTYTHPFSKQGTTHASQSVFHGPVAYVDDPYAYVASAANPFEEMLRSAFFKHTRFRNQREYRFLVWCEDEPDELTPHLHVSQEMRASLAASDDEPPVLLPASSETSRTTSVATESEEPGKTPSVPPVGLDRPQASQEEAVVGSGEHDERDGADDQNGQGGVVVPIPVAIAMQLARVQPILREVVLEADCDPQAAAAAFHAGWALETLLSSLVDPLATVEWRDGGIIVTLNLPEDSGKEGRLALGPHGTGQYRIGTAEEFTEVHCDQGWMLMQALVTDLEQQGFLPWSRIPGEGVVVRASKQGPHSEPRAQREFSATIARTTASLLDTVDEVEIDRINAQEPPSPDDARISKIVIDGGPRHIAKLYGIRQGLSGNVSQRATVDAVTITVATVNPEATVEVEPTGAHLEGDGHQVSLPEGQDTSIEITATAPDGISQSGLTLVLKRSPELPDE